MKASSNHSAKSGEGGGNSKSSHEALDQAQDRYSGQPTYMNQVLPILSPSPLRDYRSMEHFTLLKLSINEIFKHHQGPAMDNTSRATPSQSLTAWVGGILLLSWGKRAPSHPLLVPPEIPKGACPTGLPQRVCPHARSRLRTTKFSILPWI